MLPLADVLTDCCHFDLFLGHLGAMLPGSPQLKLKMLVFCAACADE